MKKIEPLSSPNSQSWVVAHVKDWDLFTWHVYALDYLEKIGVNAEDAKIVQDIDGQGASIFHRK